MTHGRFIFRTMVITAVACVVGAANECLHVTTTRATTVRTDSGFCVLGPKPMHRSPPVWVILDGIDPSGRSAVHIPRGRAPRQKISIRDGVAAMAMAAAVLAARVAALGEGLGLIERDNSPSLRATQNGL